MKIELKLAKAVGSNWSCLEAFDPASSLKVIGMSSSTKACFWGLSPSGLWSFLISHVFTSRTRQKSTAFICRSLRFGKLYKSLNRHSLMKEEAQKYQMRLGLIYIRKTWKCEVRSSLAPTNLYCFSLVLSILQGAFVGLSVCFSNFLVDTIKPVWGEHFCGLPITLFFNLARVQLMPDTF